MSDDWAFLLALDPGGTTGWCVMAVQTEALVEPKQKILNSIMHWTQGQIIGDKLTQLDEVGSLMEAWDAPVCSERFVIRKFIQGDEFLLPHDLNFAIEHICSRGATLYLPGSREGMRILPRPFVLQQPAEAMATATNDRLKDWGLYLANDEPHARDATRHAITIMRKAKESERLRSQLWPALYGESA